MSVATRHAASSSTFNRLGSRRISLILLRLPGRSLDAASTQSTRRANTTLTSHSPWYASARVDSSPGAPRVRHDVGRGGRKSDSCVSAALTARHRALLLGRLLSPCTLLRLPFLPPTRPPPVGHRAAEERRVDRRCRRIPLGASGRRFDSSGQRGERRAGRGRASSDLGSRSPVVSRGKRQSSRDVSNGSVCRSSD